jgi:hypothetical protein
MPAMNLLKAASTVSLLTLASRVTGLVREQLIAASLRRQCATDAFNVAFRCPTCSPAVRRGRLLAGLRAAAGRHARARRRRGHPS